jgi:hypothetical protein
MLLELRDTEMSLQTVRSGRLEQDLERALKKRVDFIRRRCVAISREMGALPRFSEGGAVRRVGEWKRFRGLGKLLEQVLGVDYHALFSEVAHGNADSAFLAPAEVLPRVIFDTIVWFSQASWWEFEYRGVDCQRVVPILEETWDQAEFPRDSRFWEKKPQPPG